MKKPDWIKHYIGMATDPKFADIIGEYCLEGTAFFWMFVAMLEATAHTGGVFAMSSDTPHSKYSLRSVFAPIIGCADDDLIQKGLSVLTEKNILEKDMFGIYRIKNFEKYQHESLSTNRVQKHRNKEKHEDMVTEVIQILNATKQALGYDSTRGYSTKTKPTRQFIGARLDEGFTVEDFRKVITFKASKWYKDEKMKQFVRPQTLFNPTNFDTYLNEVPDNWDCNIETKKLLKVETMSGVKKTITQEQFDRAEKGYFTIIG